MFCLRTSVYAQVSTCACSEEFLSCNTPGNYKTTTPSNQTLWIQTTFEEKCIEGISFIPSNAQQLTECRCQNNFDNMLCSNTQYLKQQLYYKVLASLTNGQSPPGQYCFLSNYATCETLSITGTFNYAKKCFKNVAYKPVTVDGVALKQGDYTQSIDCQAADMSNGYLSIENFFNSQIVYELTASGINSSGIFFIPSVHSKFDEVKMIMQEYMQGNAVELPSWLFLQFTRRQPLKEAVCTERVSYSIPRVSPSKINQCTVLTQISIDDSPQESMLNSNNLCFQIKNCTSLKGEQGFYSYSQTGYSFTNQKEVCLLNGAPLGGNYTQTNNSGFFFSNRKSSCQFSFQLSSEFVETAQPSCEFDPQQGVDGGIDGSDRQDRGESQTSIMEIALPLIVVTILALQLVVLRSSNKQFNLQLRDENFIFFFVEMIAILASSLITTHKSEIYSISLQIFFVVSSSFFGSDQELKVLVFGTEVMLVSQIVLIALGGWFSFASLSFTLISVYILFKNGKTTNSKSNLNSQFILCSGLAAGSTISGSLILCDSIGPTWSLVFFMSFPVVCILVSKFDKYSLSISGLTIIFSVFISHAETERKLCLRDLSQVVSDVMIVAGFSLLAASFFFIHFRK